MIDDATLEDRSSGISPLLRLYDWPEIPAARGADPAAFKEMAGNDQWKMATPSDGLLKGKWWEIFGDPQLNRLEELVDINNQNVKQAEAQFRQARALVAANHANYYPTIGSAPAITQSYIGRNREGVTADHRAFPCPAPRLGSRICGAGFVCRSRMR